MTKFAGKLLKNNFQRTRNVTISNFTTVDEIKKDQDEIKPTFLLKDGIETVAAVSCWVSPKRTRSYPFARVLHTLYQKDCKKITIIPVVKDEGGNMPELRKKPYGDRDYLQYATVMMMTFLGVYLIPAYYVDAELNNRPSERKKMKITKQKFDSIFISKKIQEILKTKKTVQEWNDSIRDSISEDLADVIKEKYTNIQRKTGGKLHDLDVMHKFLKNTFDPDNFKSKSARSSAGAAKGETQTSNKKEKTFGFPKAQISFNIKDIPGECDLTTDGYHIINETLFLLECKHSKNGIKADDIEDALFKYHFFNQINEFSDGNSTYDTKTVIVASSEGKTTKEILSELNEISEECEKNSIIFIPIGKNDLKNGKEKILQKLDSIAKN
tara:strand:- start:39 stop:1187 length:1149 start_codon:yes stop_codon:yes gene_type:complete